MTNSPFIVPQTYADRDTYIGGSDLADILNEEPYGCRNRLWREKRGERPDFEGIVSGPMMRGKKLEDIFAAEYEELTGRKVRKQHGATRDREYRELGGHIDRHIIAFDERGPGVLEIKSMSEWAFRRFKKEGLPAGYILQLQYYIQRKGWKWGSYLIGHADSWSFEWWDVEANREMAGQLDEEARLFWAEVKSNREPAKLKPSDPRCHSCGYRTSCQGKALMEQAGERPTLLEIDPVFEPLLRDYFDMKRLASEAAEEVTRVAEQIKTLLGKRTAVRTIGGSVFWNAMESKRLHAATIERFAVDLAVEYMLLTQAVQLVPEECRPDLSRLAELVERTKNFKQPSVSRPFRIFAQ